MKCLQDYNKGPSCRFSNTMSRNTVGRTAFCAQLLLLSVLNCVYFHSISSRDLCVLVCPAHCSAGIHCVFLY